MRPGQNSSIKGVISFDGSSEDGALGVKRRRITCSAPVSFDYVFGSGEWIRVPTKLGEKKGFVKMQLDLGPVLRLRGLCRVSGKILQCKSSGD